MPQTVYITGGKYVPESMVGAVVAVRYTPDEWEARCRKHRMSVPPNGRVRKRLRKRRAAAERR